MLWICFCVYLYYLRSSGEAARGRTRDKETASRVRQTEQAVRPPGQRSACDAGAGATEPRPHSAASGGRTEERRTPAEGRPAREGRAGGRVEQGAGGAGAADEGQAGAAGPGEGGVPDPAGGPHPADPRAQLREQPAQTGAHQTGAAEGAADQGAGEGLSGDPRPEEADGAGQRQADVQGLRDDQTRAQPAQGRESGSEESNQAAVTAHAET